ncbi:MAG: sigma-E processing peptidase SpoIIGA [Oscillospiraceae bacterium]|nr:sigma-E processing peptidase SpoIIGA [Oscillospiraceae bacterium]
MNQAATVIYIDTLFTLNAVVNYLVLLTTAKICTLAIKRWRLAVAAGVGALYAVIAFMPRMGFVSAFALQIAASAAIACIAFGIHKRTIRAGLTFWAVGLLFGGCVYAVNILTGQQAGMMINNVPYVHISARMLLLTSGFFYVVLTLVFKGAALTRRHGGASVTLECGGRSVTLKAMHDSGNTLTDPISGTNVLIADSKALRALWTSEIYSLLTPDNLCDPTAVMLTLDVLKLPAKFRLIPYKAIGTDSGLLLGFKPDKIIINGTASDTFVALSPTPIENGNYSAIVNLT